MKKSTIKHCNACMMSHTCDILQEANENGGKFEKFKKKNALQVSILQKCLEKKEIKAK